MRLGGDWHVVESVCPRSSYAVLEKDEDKSCEEEQVYQEDYLEDLIGVQENVDLSNLKRGDMLADEAIETGILNSDSSAKRARKMDDFFVDDDEIQQLSSSEDESEKFVESDDYESD